MVRTVRQVSNRMGVPFVTIRDDKRLGRHLDGVDVLGSPPTTSAFLVLDRGVTKVVFDGKNLGALLHELVHGWMGVVSYNYDLDEGESGLMALQYAIIQKLGDEKIQQECRREFAFYIYGTEEVGNGPGFLRTQEWKEIVKNAKDRGLLDGEGNPIWTRERSH